MTLDKHPRSLSFYHQDIDLQLFNWHYTDLPKFYTFGTKERILYENFVKVNQDVEKMCNEIMQFAKK